MPLNNNPDEEKELEVRIPKKEKRETLATVESLLGANRVRINCIDGITRIGRITGTIKKDTWLRVGDLVLAIPWDFQDSKADVIWKYTRQQVEWFQSNGYLKDQT